MPFFPILSRHLNKAKKKIIWIAKVACMLFFWLHFDRFFSENSAFAFLSKGISHIVYFLAFQQKRQQSILLHNPISGNKSLTSPVNVCCPCVSIYASLLSYTVFLNCFSNRFRNPIYRFILLRYFFGSLQGWEDSIRSVLYVSQIECKWKILLHFTCLFLHQKNE